MSDHAGRLIARGRGALPSGAPLLRPKLASAFEPEGAGGFGEESVEVEAAPAVPAARGAGPDLPLHERPPATPLQPAAPPAPQPAAAAALVPELRPGLELELEPEQPAWPAARTGAERALRPAGAEPARPGPLPQPEETDRGQQREERGARAPQQPARRPEERLAAAPAAPALRRRERPAASASQGSGDEVVHVTIGRIDVHAQLPQPERPRPAPAREQTLVLADYLRAREGKR
jgi:hypothetical protein